MAAAYGPRGVQAGPGCGVAVCSLRPAPSREIWLARTQARSLQCTAAAAAAEPGHGAPPPWCPGRSAWSGGAGGGGPLRGHTTGGQELIPPDAWVTVTPGSPAHVLLPGHRVLLRTGAAGCSRGPFQATELRTPHSQNMEACFPRGTCGFTWNHLKTASPPRGRSEQCGAHFLSSDKMPPPLTG